MKKVLHFYYSGGYRLVEPFCHGTSKALNEVLSGYQVSGYSESGSPNGWRLFKVSEIENISIDELSFLGNRPNYNPNDSRMVQIHCHI